ncbi:hypothetical protein PSP31121_05326 [Pandoraea sputorum]|uniref:Uncharacterized protein n=1 Tax=Pandoraea sputorum TaxID=93222 RepID=A0A5E5BK27_9BURK|nr:hypothetical protein PSP31121_05326 [Pandoraea sputorum]
MTRRSAPGAELPKRATPGVSCRRSQADARGGPERGGQTAVHIVQDAGERATRGQGGRPCEGRPPPTPADRGRVRAAPRQLERAALKLARDLVKKLCSPLRQAVAMKYATMEQMRPHYPVPALCRRLGVSVSGDDGRCWPWASTLEASAGRAPAGSSKTGRSSPHARRLCSQASATGIGAAR